MAKLPTSLPDPTLQASDAALVATQDRSRRKYLGMSAIGGECERKLWLTFRWARQETFDAPTLKRFEDGHRTEALIISRLKMVEGLELIDTEPDGGQIRCSDFGGHFSGHLDWMCRGLLQAPKAWHVGEMKASAKIGELEKHKDRLGEKNALLAWNVTYYAQAQCYMGYQGVDRHWLVCTNPGGREWTSVRTDFDPVAFMRLKGKAERIIFSPEPPERVGGPTDFRCKRCHMADLCHGDGLPDRECRICLHATPERAGIWSCAIGNAFGNPCQSHRFIPGVLNKIQTDVVDGNVVYEDGYVDCGA